MQITNSSAELLRPYVPRLLISWLRDSPDARHREVEGSLAFVDISGFTQLTERLARRGKVGFEEISDTLDTTFTELLSVAYDYDAGVIKWGGDAVLLLYTGDGHAARACRASFGMQRTMRQFGRLQTSAGLVRLRMSIGIHSGRFDFFLVGDVHRELVLTGPGATETIAMESAAAAGEIVVSRATAASLDASLLGAEKDGGIRLTRAPDAAPRRAVSAPRTTGIELEQCFPPAIRDHLLAGGGEPEHRLVTAAFVGFDGTETLLERSGPESVADALDELVSTVQEAAVRHDVVFFDSDAAPNGGKIMLVAGAPRSGGHDEERMLRTLRQIIDGAGVLPLAAGVTSGRVFADQFGPYYRRTYSVKGDAVNLAARLLGKARPGQILGTESVVQRSQTTFELEPVERFLVKGKSRPIAAVGIGPALQSRTAAASDAPLVGRDRELADLLSALDSARQGDGRLVEVVGEAGIGKSRLVEELRARAPDVATLSASCEEYESSTPYFPFAPLLRDLLGIGGASDSVAAARLEERVVSMAPELEPWLPLLAIPLGIEVPATPETDRLDEKFRKAQLERVASEFFGRILTAPTLFVFEDTHWLDDASADLVRRLARDAVARPWLILTTRRPEGPPLGGPDLPGSSEITVEPLTAEAAALLVRTATEDLPLPGHQLGALADRGGGNPLFLTELVAASRGPGGDEAMPDSVEALVTAQIDRLAPADRALLRYAAVLGRTFDERLLTASLAGRTEVPDDAWARLAGFLNRDPHGTVRFRHALIRDAAYEGLSYRRRRELHARAGETLEQSNGEAELLSLHFFHAQRFEEAWRYSLVAGDRARGIYANAEAADFYLRAIDSARRVTGIPRADLAHVSESLGDALERLGLFGQSAAAYRDARRHRAGDVIAETALMLKEGWIAEREGRFPQALRWFTRGLKLLEGAESRGAGARRANLLAGYATVRQMQGRSAEAIRWCRAAVEEAELAAEPKALAQAYYVMDWAYMELGRREEAVSMPLALAIYDDLDDLANQALVREAMGAFAYHEGRWEAAVELYERARDDFGKVGAYVLRAADTFNIGEIRCDQGRLDEAEPLLHDALRVWKAACWPSMVALATRQLGSVAFRHGRLDDALELFEHARAAFADIGAQHELVDTDGRIAECLLLQGSVRGLEVAIDALARCKGLGERSVHVPMLQRVTGYGLLQSGDLDGASEAFEQSLLAGRDRGAKYQVALTLDALVRLAEIRLNGSIDDLEAERDSILVELAVVALPPAPTRIEALVLR